MKEQRNVSLRPTWLLTLVFVFSTSFLELSSDISANTTEKHKCDVVGSFECDKATHSYNLKLSLSNNANSDLTVFVGRLPWENWYAVTLVAIPAHPAARPLEQRVLIDDPGPGSTTVKSRTTISGHVKLHQHFPKLEEVLRDHDVIVFWQYNLKDTTGIVSKYGGWVEIPSLRSKDK